VDFVKHVEVDKGPVVRWISNGAMNVSSWLVKKFSPYADMYTAIWDDYEEDDKNDSSTWDTNYHDLMVSPPNQMVDANSANEWGTIWKECRK
jgi:hypothetical protein